MSRLIREEDVLKIIRNGWSNHWSCKEMCEAIGDISTAYDVDKVVEKLENKQKEAVLKAPAYAGLHDKQFQKWMMKSFGFEEAIEIVKAGGVE